MEHIKKYLLSLVIRKCKLKSQQDATTYLLNGPFKRWLHQVLART